MQTTHQKSLYAVLYTLMQANNKKQGTPPYQIDLCHSGEADCKALATRTSGTDSGESQMFLSSYARSTA